MSTFSCCVLLPSSILQEIATSLRGIGFHELPSRKACYGRLLGAIVVDPTEGCCGCGFTSIPKLARMKSRGLGIGYGVAGKETGGNS